MSNVYDQNNINRWDYIIYLLICLFMVKVFYLKNTFWEIDFLVNDIFVGLDVCFFNDTEPMLLEPGDIGNCLLVVNDAHPLERVLKIVKKIKPVCIFHLSDETGCQSDWFVLANHCRYLFKQHNHRHCRLDIHPNIIQLTLGYVPTMFETDNISRTLTNHNPTTYNNSKINNGSSTSFDFIDNLKPIRERDFEWSFIGSMKSDRQELCHCFANMFPKRYISVSNNTWDYTKQCVRPSDMADIYRKTVFAPIGRGWVTLDCYRLYEALLCGAIPVVVGPSDEIDTAYWYGGRMPAFIRAASWSEAAAICGRMIGTEKDLVELQKIQDRNVAWWKEMILGYRAKIQEALTHIGQK